MLNLKNINSFFHEKSPNTLYLFVMCDLTHLQDRNTKVIFMKIRKIHVGSETFWKVGSGSEKIWIHNTAAFYIQFKCNGIQLSLDKSLTKATTLGPNQGFRPNNYGMAHTPCCWNSSRECTFLREVETEALASCKRKVSKLSLSGSVSASSLRNWGGGMHREGNGVLSPPSPSCSCREDSSQIHSSYVTGGYSWLRHRVDFIPPPRDYEFGYW
jgi:hypothetical protein